MNDTDHLSIGDTADATGITPQTLRVWERRYGRPQPERLPSGHRRYRGDQIRWLRRVAEALSRGYRPGRVVPLDEAGLDALLRQEAGAEEAPEHVAEMLQATRRYDETGLAQALRREWTSDDAVGYLDEVLAPFIEAVGRAWADGGLDVRHEHFASQVVQTVLREFRVDFHAPRSIVPDVLLTTLAGEQHGLGLHMAGLVCASMRIQQRILGVDTPNEEIAEAARELGVSLVGISVSLATSGVDTDRAISALRASLPDGVLLVVGGQGARGVRRGPRGVRYVQTLKAWAALLSEEFS